MLPNLSGTTRLSRALRQGITPPDEWFDRLLPPPLQDAADVFWTPLEVAVRAAEWIDQHGISSVADIGAGVGKFCIAVALASHASVVGLEHRKRLVEVATTLAEELELGSRARFIHAAFASESLPEAELYYLYNPFAENLHGGSSQLDTDVELSRARHDRDVALAEAVLRSLPRDTHVLTYNGFGGMLPDDFRPIRVARDVGPELRLWRKEHGYRRPDPRQGAYVRVRGLGGGESAE